MKITDRGYWVSKLYKYQSLCYWLAFSLYFRSLTYFSVANPRIYLGGMLNERKSDIYDLVPKKYVPHTKLYSSKTPDNEQKILSDFTFPLIIKPNIGYKGHLVRKVDSPGELKWVLREFVDREFIVQEFISAPKEYSVMFYKFHNKDMCGISSLVEKHLPYITGDGRSTIAQLIQNLNNPFLKKNRIRQKNSDQLNRVMKVGEKVVVDYIGNYSCGAKFENLNHKIDKMLVASMRSFFSQVSGMNFCRLDVKADSFEEFKRGDFKILEINGAKSEPLHIYDPSVSVWKIISDISFHWKILFKIVRANISIMQFPSSVEGIKSWRSLKKMMER